MAQLKDIHITDFVQDENISRATVRFLADTFGINQSGNVSSEILISHLRTSNNDIGQWVTKKYGRYVVDYRQNLLTCFQQICRFLIEQSDFMSDVTEPEQRSLRHELSAMVDNAQDYQDAILLLKSGYGRTEAHIEKIFAKLQKTGYVYQPSRTFRTLIAIFELRPDLMMEKMIQMVDILAVGKTSSWCNPSMRPYIVTLLDFFICEMGKKVDRMAGFDSKSDREILEIAIKALAIELFLYDEAEDDIHFFKRLSMLYRFSAYYCPEYQDELLKKAFNSLAGGYNTKMEFSWEKISSVQELILLIKVERKAENTQLRYDGEKASVFIEDGNLSIMPRVINRQKAQKAIAAGVLPWHNLQIYLIDIPKKPSIKAVTIDEYRKWWTELERCLFLSKIKTPANKPAATRKPRHEECVDIVIDGIADISNSIFKCHVVSDGIEASGTISISDIVPYKIRSVDLNKIINKAFVDSKSGLPFIFSAEARIDSRSDEYKFVMKDLILEYIVNNVEYQDLEMDAVVTAIISYNNTCACVGSEGITILVPNNDDLKPGDNISVRVVDSIYDRKLGRQFVGEYLGVAFSLVTQQDALVQLLLFYSNEKTFNESENQKRILEEQKKRDPYTQIDDSSVIELMQLLDCEAMAQTEVHKRYNYLAMGKILAMVINDTQQELYYENRLILQQLLEKFSRTSSIDNSIIQALDTLDERTKNKYPLLKLRIDELHALDCIGKPDKNQILYEMQEKASNQELKKLLTLAIAYNNLYALNMEEECEKLSERINELLCFKYIIKPAELIGTESEQIEFKTSAVFIANEEHKVIGSPAEQMEVLKKEICAFLNTKGGTLYIGVNDQGYAVGINDDIEWFREHSHYKVSNLDQYQRYLLDSILKTWKGLNPLLSLSLENRNDRYIIVIKVTPSRSPIDLNGIYYNRVGASCRMIAKESETSFMQRRPLLYDQIYKQ